MQCGLLKETSTTNGVTKMTNDNNNNEDNRIELIGLNEFIQDVADIELDWGVDEDERPFPDSDDDIRALQDDVEDMEVEIARLRAELKTSNAERDEARREVCDWMNTDESGCVKSGSAETAIERGWDCFKNQETK